VVDLTGHEARLDGELMALRPREFAVLAKHVGQVLSRDQLMEQAYPDPGAAEARAVDVAISHVRKAFGKHAWLIQTYVRSGYKLVAQPAPKARR
jgi:two-component system phosphate regulon response regulator PhoB